MTLDLNAFLVAVDAAWQPDIATLEAQVSADEAEIAAQEADVLLLEGVAPPVSGLDAPKANPVTALVVGPTATVDTGWKDLGGTDHSFRSERADSADSGAMSLNADIFLFCDTGDGSPNYGFKASTANNGQYITYYYRNGSSWTVFPGGEANTNFGRQLLREDVVDFTYADGTISIFLNGTLNKKFPASVFTSKFPNGLGRYARYARTSGSYTQKVTLSGGVISPLTVRSIELDADALPIFTFDYTGSPYGYVVRILDGSGNGVTAWKPATLTENAAKGRASYRGPDKAPKVSIGYTYQLTEANGDGSPKSGVVPISKSIVAPGPMEFGVNITFDGYNNNPRRSRICAFRSHFSNYNYGLKSWADPVNPEVNPEFTGVSLAAFQQIMTDNQTTNILTGPNASPSSVPDQFKNRGNGTGSGPVFEVAGPRLSGQRMRVRWKGVADHITTNDFRNIIKNPQRGTDGVRSWFDYDHVYDATIPTKNPAPSDFINAWFRMVMVNGTIPTELEAYYIDGNGNALSSGYWDPDYIDDMKHFVGHTNNGPRMMDVQRIINMYDRVFTADHIADGLSRLPGNGWGYQMCFSFFEAIGVGGQVHIPLQADESFVRKAANIGAVWSARTKLTSAWELSNEIWNSGQYSYGKAVELGRAMGFTATKIVDGQTVEDANGIRIQYNSFRHRQVMQWVTDEYSKVPGASPYLKRVLGCWNNSPSNSLAVANSDPLCLAFTDELQGAPYLGNGYAQKYPYVQNDPSGITDAMLDEYIARIKNESIPYVFGCSAEIRDFALSKGKSFGCYEGLLEDPLNGNFFIRLKNDAVRWPALVTYILSEYKRLVGGHYRGYYDNSMAWGFRANISQDAYVSINGLPNAGGTKAWYDFIAAQPTL